MTSLRPDISVSATDSCSVIGRRSGSDGIRSDRRPLDFSPVAVHLQGTTGFDVVGSWGWLRAEVPGGLVNHRENHMCGLSRVRPRRLAHR